MYRHTSRPGLNYAGLFAVFSAVLAVGTLQAADKGETKTIKFKDKNSDAELSLAVPADWTQQKPESNLRLGQFQIPAAEGDDQPGELAIFVFPGGGGGVKDNLNRWIKEFSPEGREVKLFKGESSQGPYFLSDITGTYNKRIGPPIAQKTAAVPGSRALGIILQIPDQNSFYLKFTGPAKTVTAAEKAYKKAIGANVDKEEAYELK